MSVIHRDRLHRISYLKERMQPVVDQFLREHPGTDLEVVLRALQETYSHFASPERGLLHRPRA